jgi:hypothetical protein
MILPVAWNLKLDAYTQPATVYIGECAGARLGYRC